MFPITGMCPKSVDMFLSVHSIMNKVTGGLLFVFPLTLSFIDLRYSAAVVCVAATAAAIHEGYLIVSER